MIFLISFIIILNLFIVIYIKINIYNLYTNFNIIFTNNNTNPLMMSNNFKKKIDYPIIKDKLNNLLKYME